ncbi:MAG TPA: DUF2442 domain-containing protein [Pyrinomonadaceae bacterium]|nr:DUF2442 domain-containing protein [Pyrinomonadaceae bacterium]
MKSETPSSGTLEVGVTQISKHGIGLFLKERARFLSFENFPWFRNAAISAIHNVDVLNEHHIYWSDLDIDLAVESIENPELFPLISKPS